MAEIRPQLDAWLDRTFGDGFLRRRWEGEILHLSGPGSEGTARLVDGVLRVEVDLRPPASFLRSMIAEKIERALNEAVKA